MSCHVTQHGASLEFIGTPSRRIKSVKSKICHYRRDHENGRTKPCRMFLNLGRRTIRMIRIASVATTVKRLAVMDNGKNSECLAKITRWLQMYGKSVKAELV